ncbi:MAG TPA: Gfo/Idh/MocA family oxidoreductase [Glaciibacter sp.]|nr:Gfo/Idh/MocA family oxidoreductase [Glaciibacter sp.]
MATAQKRVAVIGVGVMGRHHARVVAESDRARLARVIDPSPDGVATARLYDSEWAPELSDLTGIDAVVLATPTATHYELAMAVLDNDVPLLIEKPVVDRLPQTEEILAMSEVRGIPLLCGLLERYNPAIVTAGSILDGPLHITATRHSPYAPRIRTGVMWDLLIHDVDLAIRLMRGAPCAVEARRGYVHPLSDEGAEDVAEAILEFDGTRIAQISASRVGQRKVRALSIYEAERLIEVDLLRRDVTIYRHVSESPVDGGARGYRQQTVIEIPELLTSTEPLVAQFNVFLDLVDGTRDAAKERAGILESHRVVDEIARRGRDH